MAKSHRWTPELIDALCELLNTPAARRVRVTRRRRRRVVIPATRQEAPPAQPRVLEELVTVWRGDSWRDDGQRPEETQPSR